MSLEFIRHREGAHYLAKAKRQQKDLRYLVQSDVQMDVNVDYLEKYAARKYKGSDEFLNWVKLLFKSDNFLSFYKYLRNPLPSAQIVEKDIIPALHRVFYSEDGYFQYTVKNEKKDHIEELHSKEFNKDIFRWLLFNYNDIVVIDAKGINEPVRNLIKLESVISIDADCHKIHRLAYAAEAFVEGRGEVQGYVYLDEYGYKFYNKSADIDALPLLDIPHDLGECPAYFVAAESFDEYGVVRKSVFSHIREELEEYVFLKTLLKMTNVNGVIPIVTMVKSRDKKNTPDIDGTSDKQPMASNTIAGQRSEVQSEITPSESVLQAGTIVKVPPMLKVDQSLDMDAVKNWINFFHTPVEPMRFIKERISEIRVSIINSVIGDLTEHNDEAKNELQVKGGFVTAEDRIRMFATEMTRLRLLSDNAFLSLKYGPDAVTVEGTYGSDFYLENTDSLYALFEKTPNVIERKNILLRLARNRNKHNRERATRESILYSLIPYISDKDFDSAVNKQMVDAFTFQYQTRFEYWVTLFESQYGDLNEFWNGIEGTTAEKQILVNNLIGQLIKEHVPTLSEETKQQEPTQP